MNAIVLKNVSKSFKSNDIIKNVSLQVESGRSLYIQGNASDTSVLLMIMGLAVSADSGNVYVFDEDTSIMNGKELRRLRNKDFGYIGQAFPLIDSWSVTKNVELPMIYSDERIDSTDRISIARALLEEAGLSHKAKAMADKLSSEERIAVQLVRARCGGGSIILADNPTGRLQHGDAERIMNMLFDMNSQGATLVVTGEDDMFSDRFSDRFIFEKGCLKEEYWGSK